MFLPPLFQTLTRTAEPGLTQSSPRVHVSSCAFFENILTFLQSLTPHTIALSSTPPTHNLFEAFPTFPYTTPKKWQRTYTHISYIYFTLNDSSFSFFSFRCSFTFYFDFVWILYFHDFLKRLFKITVFLPNYTISHLQFARHLFDFRIYCIFSHII